MLQRPNNSAYVFGKKQGKLGDVALLPRQHRLAGLARDRQTCTLVSLTCSYIGDVSFDLDVDAIFSDRSQSGRAEG